MRQQVTSLQIDVVRDDEAGGKLARPIEISVHALQNLKRLAPRATRTCPKFGMVRYAVQENGGIIDTASCLEMDPNSFAFLMKSKIPCNTGIRRNCDRV